MTDKENFDQLKAAKKARKNKIKLLNFLQGNLNKRILTSSDEEEKVNLLAELEAVEINKFNMKQNKYGSQFYSFEVVKPKRYKFK